MIIDIHTHLFPERFAASLTHRLSQNSGLEPVCLPTPAETARQLAGWGVERAVFLPVATSLRYRGSNDFARQVADNYPLFLSFGTLHPAVPDLPAAVAEIAELGLRGVKLHPQFLGLPVDDPLMVAAVRAAAARRLPVLFHAGHDPGLPPPCLARPEAIARLLDQVEDVEGLTLIAAHLGGFEQWDEVELYLVGRNICFDTALLMPSPTSPGCPPEQFRRIVEQHGAERVLLGSDCPWQSTAAAADGVRALGLPPTAEAAILGGNAQRLLGL